MKYVHFFLAGINVCVCERHIRFEYIYNGFFCCCCSSAPFDSNYAHYPFRYANQVNVITQCSKQIICKQSIIKSEIKTGRSGSQYIMILKSLFFTSMNASLVPVRTAYSIHRTFFFLSSFIFPILVGLMICLSAFISVISRLPLCHSMCFCVTSDLAFMT